MSSKHCLDTMVLIWGVQYDLDRSNLQRHPAGEERQKYAERVDRLGSWFDAMEDEEIVELVVPAPVLSEYLVAFEQPIARQQNRSRVSELSEFYALGEAESALAAELFRKANNQVDGSLDDDEKPRVKADAMIAATAHLARCDTIVTDDSSDFRPYGEHISPEIRPVDDLPDPPQPELPNVQS